MAILALEVLKNEEPFVLFQEVHEQKVSEDPDLDVLGKVLKHILVFFAHCIVLIHCPFISEELFNFLSKLRFHLLTFIVILYESKELGKVVGVI